MKKITPLLLIIFTIITAHAQAGTEIKKSYAEVNQYSGMYVFFDCKPLREYTFIATMKKTCVAESTADAFTKYAAMARKEHPDADGIIFHELSMGFSRDKFDVIKFK